MIASGLIGNLLEAFDVMICAFFSQIIAEIFFPPMSSLSKLFYIFNVFLVGYLSRPIGSLLISLYADQIGRKRTLIFSIFIVGIGTATIGLIPSYSSIGILSTLLFLIFRIIQNVSIGGEYITSIAYLIEHSDNNKRGFYGSWVAVGFNCGTLLASLFAFLTIYLITIGAIPSWSWRIIFFSSIIGMFLGIWMRLSLPESIGFILENSSTIQNTKSLILKNSAKFIRSYLGQCIAIFAIAWFGVCTTFAIFIYSPIHLSTIHHFSQHTSLGINTLSLVLLIILIPIFGILSDHFNKINLLIISSLLILLLSFPYFWYLSYGTYYQILAIKLVFSVLTACFFAIAPVVITEIFPIKIRCTSVALVYQTSSSLASGLTPIIMLYLANSVNAPYSPFYLLMGSSFLGLIGLYYIKHHPIILPSENDNPGNVLSFDTIAIEESVT